MPPQPWYTSKVLWTLLVGFALNVLKFFGVIDPSADVTVLANSALMILALAFRWGADQPLTLRGGIK